MKKKIVFGIAGVGLLLAVVMGVLNYRGQAAPWYEKYPVICHALGRSEEGDFLTNSREA